MQGINITRGVPYSPKAARAQREEKLREEIRACYEERREIMREDAKRYRRRRGR